jgi:hypothetical protein
MVAEKTIRMPEPFVIAKIPEGPGLQCLPAFANRQGLITGATGTGRTITLQVLADQFSRLGAPVFVAEITRSSRSRR